MRSKSHVSKFLDIFSHRKDLNKLLDVLGHLFGLGITILINFKISSMADSENLCLYLRDKRETPNSFTLISDPS